MANESVVNSARILVFKALLCPKVAEVLGNNLTVTHILFHLHDVNVDTNTRGPGSLASLPVVLSLSQP